MRKNTCQAVAIALLVLAVSGNGMAATSSKLAQIFDPEMIGADLAYLEQSTGPARNTHADTKVYKVEGCEVSATIGNGSVRALRLLLGPRCSFDLASFLPNYAGRLPPLQALTFGRFDAATGGDGRFHADCLSLCGTATDPTVLLHWSGSNADGGLEVMLEASQIDERVGAAAGDWTAAMEKNEGMDWIVDTRFNCTREYDALAHRLFRDIAVSAITIGHALPTPSCE